MNVEFFNFSKKRNSTKQPTSGSGISYNNVELKIDCSIVAPVLRIAVSSMPVATVAPVNTMTYCYIQKFNRYYFIEDWVYIPGMWEAHLVLDVLASHKTEIGATSAYVERSASSYDGSIIDGLYPANTQYQISTVSLSYAYNAVTITAGTFVLGVINSLPNTTGAISYYAMTHSQVQALLSYMYGNDIWSVSNISEIGEGLWKSMFNPFQYIASCIWFPFDRDTFGSSENTTTLKLGYYDTNVSNVYRLQYTGHKGHISATIPEHPQAASRGAYLNYSPFTEISLYVPPFGVIPVDPAFRRLGNALYCPYWVDHITGQATFRVCLAATSGTQYDTNPMTERSGMIGVPIQLAQVYSDYTHSLNTLMSAGSAGSAAGLLTNAISGVIQSAIDAAFPVVTTSGADGSFIECLATAHAVCKFSRIVDGDNTDLGRPLMQVKVINTLSGYIKCAEAHFSAPCFAGERAQIEEYMKTGFFYE